MGRLIPIIGAAAVALLVGAGIGWFLGSASAPAPAEAHDAGPEYIEYQIKDRTVTLADPGARRYLKVSLVLQVLPAKGKVQADQGRGAIVLVALDEPSEGTLLLAAGGGGGGAKTPAELPNSAQVHHVLTTVLSSKRSDEIATTEGRERLREELKAKINQVMPKDLQVVNVLFTDFIIQ